ncbi:MAG: nuclear transport factor 2 family protein [Rhodobiaceae bacterium]|nr:nuclear transport factor 2 family protein [Rhodobiaceae bacterium]MCC0056277.1 nuclear transport factor 2 family protein [Rhodobiaceae bacterium]
MTDRNDGAELAREKISAFLKAYGKRDIGGLLELVDDDAVLEDEKGDRRFGSEAFKTYFVSRFAHGRETIGDVAAMASADGSRGAAEFTLRGEREGGDSYSLNKGLFFALDGGMITRVSGLPV